MMKKGQNKQQNNKRTDLGNFLDWYCNIPDEEKEDADKEEEASQPHQEGKTSGTTHNNQPHDEEEEKMEQDQSPTKHSREERRGDPETEHRRHAQGPEQETAGKTSFLGRTISKTGDRKSQAIRPNSRKRKCQTQLQQRQKTTARGTKRTPKANDPNQKETRGKTKTSPPRTRHTGARDKKMMDGSEAYKKTAGYPRSTRSSKTAEKSPYRTRR